MRVIGESNPLNFLVPGEQSPSHDPSWATVTSVSPLRVRKDNEASPLTANPQTLVTGLQLGDRVILAEWRNGDTGSRQPVIIGKGGGIPLPSPSTALPTAPGPVPVVGTSTDYARADHAHPAPPLGTLPDVDTTGAAEGDLLRWDATAGEWQPHSGSPFAQAAGLVTIPGGSGSTTSESVTFPAGRFTVAPIVTMTYQGTAASGLEAGYGAFGVTTTGFDAYLRRNSATGAIFYWHAIQMTSTTADG